MINSENRLKQSISFLTASILTTLLIFCLSLIRDKLDIETITANYNLDIKDFVAENSEKLQYIFGTISFPLFFIISRFYFDNKSLRSISKLNNIFSYGCFSTILILAIIIISKSINILLLFFYLPSNNLNLSNKVIAITLFLSVMFALLAFLRFYENLLCSNRSTNCPRRKYFNTVIYGIAALNLLFIFFLYITKTYYFNFGNTGFHFDAYFYPVYKVFCGQTPLIDFNNLYGFYPYFLVPLLKLTGGISIFRFSILMSFLLIISLFSITIVIFCSCKNKVLALIGTLSVSFVIAISPMLVEDQAYYLQYTPHRVLFPSLILLICFTIVKLKNSKLKIFVTAFGYVISVFSLLWNIDTGIVVLTTFVLFQLYLNLLKYTLKQKKLYYSIFKILLFSILTVVSAFMILLAITFARTGVLLTFSSILYSQISFYGLGFYMLKMPLWAPWLLLVILYAVFLARALSKLKLIKNSNNEDDLARYSLFFILPIIGMGIFSYYQGRSDSLVFLAVIWPGIILLIFLLSEYLGKTNIIKPEIKPVPYIDKFKFIFIFILLASITGNYITKAVLPFELKETKDKVHSVETSEISTLLSVYKHEKESGEKIDLVTLDSAAVYCVFGETIIANIPATIDWFTKDDYQRVFNYLAKTSNKVIIDEYSMDLLKKYEPDKTAGVLSRFHLDNQLDGYWIYIPS